MNLQEALAMFPPDGQPLQLRSEDLLMELSRSQVAGQILANAMRREIPVFTEILGLLGELEMAAKGGNEDEGWCMVPISLIKRPVKLAKQHFRGET